MPGNVFDLVSTHLPELAYLPSQALCAVLGGVESQQRSPWVLPPAVRSEVTSRATLTFLFSLFHLFSFPFCCLFPPCPLCSRDAAKRKAWKLNRVGSLRNIYSSSSTNTEGNCTPPARLYPAPASLPSFLPPHAAACPCCVCSPPCGLFILLFVCSVLPFMFLSAYLNSDLSLQS